MEAEVSVKERFAQLSHCLSEPSPFLPDAPLDESTPEAFYGMSFPILVIGAGGLGCEILKNLAMSGFNEIHVIDLDTIDLTNLNRQFLFRLGDVGKGKAEAAASFIMNRVKSVKVIPYNKRIQELPRSFYEQFSIIVAGLDNVEARRWLNKLVHDMCAFDDDGNIVEGTQRILIDGGTQNFSGQCMVIKPYDTNCYECILATIPKARTFNSCTIANTPRIPEHCIQYVYEIEWPKEYPDKKVDADDPAHVVWITDKAKERASKFGIAGVNEMMTLGVIKNIIPAIASTNALIAAISTNEVMKFATGSAPSLNNYFYYKGMTEIGSQTYFYEKQEDCPVCSTKPIKVNVKRTDTLSALLGKISETNKIVNPSIETNSGTLLNPLIESTQKLLSKTFEQLINDKDYVQGQRMFLNWVGANAHNYKLQVMVGLE